MPLPYKGVNLTNIGHFLFLFAFSGMEFTLTFLAMERLNYTSLENAYMFIFIGVIIALVQGGYVRRKAAIMGEKQMGWFNIYFGFLRLTGDSEKKQRNFLKQSVMLDKFTKNYIAQNLLKIANISSKTVFFLSRNRFQLNRAGIIDF